MKGGVAVKDYAQVIEENRSKWRFEDKYPFVEYLKQVQAEVGKIYNPTPQQLDFLLHLDEKTLVDSTAGSGKTTTIVAKSIIDEIVWRIEPYRIVFLTFSKKAADDMQDKRSKVIARLYGKRNSARMSTIHSYCYNFLSVFSKEPGGLYNFSKDRIVSDELVSFDDFKSGSEDTGEDFLDFGDYEDQSTTYLQTSAIDILSQFIKGRDEYKYIDNIMEIKNIMNCFAYQKETMLSDEDIQNEIPFLSLNCKFNDYVKLRKEVEEYKKLYEYFEFTDLVEKTLEILRNNREFFYNNLVFQTVFKPIKLYIDEFQDMTPLQKELIKEIVEIPVSDGTQTSLVCIGDGDQRIYSWRGASSLEFSEFQKFFDPSGQHSELKVFSKNHRCGRAILEKAERLINHNKMRNPKEMEARDFEGQYKLITYTSPREMVNEVFKEIKRIQNQGIEELENTAIIYREHKQCLGLVTAFLREGIPFNLSGMKLPYKHWIFENLMKICDALVFDTHNESIDVIYRFTPLNKETAKRVKEEKIKYEYENGEKISWIDFLKYRSKKGIKPIISDDVINELKTLREGLCKRGIPVKKVLRRLYSLYNLHNLGYVLDNLIVCDRSEIESIEYFIDSLQNEDYTDLIKNMENWSQNVESYRALRYGVKFMTLHATKGLEFKRVFIIGVDGDYLPKENYAMELSPRNRELYIEEERRLLFVGITRAIEECTVYAGLVKPSLFLKELEPNLTLPEKFQKNFNILKGNFENSEKENIVINRLNWFKDQLFKEDVKWFMNC